MPNYGENRARAFNGAVRGQHKALAVACPDCLQPPRHKCVNLARDANGDLYPHGDRKSPHPARVEAYKQAFQ